MGKFIAMKTAAIINTQGYSTRRVCQSVCLSVSQSVCQLPVMAASNSRNSEMARSIATKRSKGMGSVAFSDVILLKSLWMKREAKLTYMFGQRYQQVG